MAAWQVIETDIANGSLKDVTTAFERARIEFFAGRLWRYAEKLVETHTALTGVRSLDILHLASALMLGASDFVTFDKRQAALAGRVGLRVVAI